MVKRKHICTLIAAILVIAAMLIPALAELSIEAQMAANSAAWLIAQTAGDYETCQRLHQANIELAAQAASGGGTAAFDEATGNWEITTAGGDMIASSSSYDSGKSCTVNYSTVSGTGEISNVANNTYTTSSIDSYIAAGGSNSGLETAYNNAAGMVSSTGKYDSSEIEKTTAAEEAAVAKQLLGLTDTQAAQLQQELLVSKAEFESAKAAYTAAIAAGDTSAAAEAQARMDAAHAAAQAARAVYNYTGDAADCADGGYYDDWGTTPGSSPAPTPNVIGGGFYVPVTFSITASAGDGGTISPCGTQTVVIHSTATFTFTPDDGYRVESVFVDGVNAGQPETYTFHNISANHTIEATFEPTGEVSLSSPILTDASGCSISGGASGGSIKSGYGIFAQVPVTYRDVTDLQVRMRCDFGGGVQTVLLEETRTGVFTYPVNANSPLGRRCVYIPAETKDGSYSLTFTVTALNAAGEMLTDTQTAVVEVRGNMYEDDFTGDS